MNKITLENFRCFRAKQEARLAPLTLLVGENSTGKTSFMAMIRALWDVAFGQFVPNFKEDPYDLGSFDEIAHYRGSRDSRVDSFRAGFGLEHEKGPAHYEVTFTKEGTVPVPVTRTMKQHDIWVEHRIHDNRLRCRFGVSEKEWRWRGTDYDPERIANAREWLSSFVYLFLSAKQRMAEKSLNRIREGKSPSSAKAAEEDLKQLDDVGRVIVSLQRTFASRFRRPFASAPVRSKPRRTYDPASLTTDSEGDYIPMYLAHMHFHGGEKWETLKNRLQQFGRMSGLFDEITVKRFGKFESAPFQLHVRKFGRPSKGPWRNVIDVGYGVSQALPVVTELVRRDMADPIVPSMFLMQQPEVHLHPSAEAALGSFFCELAARGHQLTVETHSDYLLDRVRMDVRDGTSKLKPEDVSILYFERGDLEVHIHTIGLDKKGNILDAPEGYREFFRKETRRLLRF
ncbi:MAG: AAA family ATPase [Nitrospira sp.]|nr:AAA family ATPase [Nitrospira sp.]